MEKEFRPGDTVRVYVKIKEKERERISAFEGIVIRKKKGRQSSFTVRKISHGIGVEKTFPPNSPSIDRIEVRKKGNARRAKLYYLRKPR